MTDISYTNALIFGAGQVGMTLMEQLVEQGVRVTLVNRSGRVKEALPAGVKILAADITEPAQVAKAGPSCGGRLCHCPARIYGMAGKMASAGPEYYRRDGADRHTPGLCGQSLYVRSHWGRTYP